MSNVEKMITLRATLASASDDATKATLQQQIDELAKGFADSESFVPKGWREAVGRAEPLPLSKTGDIGPIDDATIAKVPAAMQAEVVHDQFAKNVTVKTFLERLKGKTFFTLGDLAVACGFDNKERNLNQIVGNAGFRAIIGSFALKGRIIKAKKGPGQGSTSNESVKAVAATLDL